MGVSNSKIITIKYSGGEFKVEFSEKIKYHDRFGSVDRYYHSLKPGVYNNGEDKLLISSYLDLPWISILKLYNTGLENYNQVDIDFDKGFSKGEIILPF